MNKRFATYSNKCNLVVNYKASLLSPFTPPINNLIVN